MKDSKIEWCSHTGNLWHGCTHAQSMGCDNCYAEVLSHRWGKNIWGNNNPRLQIKSVWKDLIRYQKLAKSEGEINSVFVGSMMDIFEKPMPLIDSNNNEVQGMDTGWLRDLFFQHISEGIYPNLMFLLLTKRPSNINKYIPEAWKSNPPKNVIFGTSPVNQPTADKIIPQILEVNGSIFLSIEPMLGEVILKPEWFDSGKIKQIIVGGESGHGKRPFNPDWARSIMAQCKQFNVPFFMKQWDKIQEIPDDLMLREFPSVIL